MTVAFVILGCSPQTTEQDAWIVPGTRVGPYVIGKSTLTDILGKDTPEARQSYAAQGLYFQFERGRKLTGVTISTDRFATREGLSVGDSVEEVRKLLGAPAGSRVEGDKIAFDAMVYDGIVFVPKDGRIVSIFVSANGGG